MRGNMSSLLRKIYCLLNWICLGTYVLSSTMMSILTRSPIVKFTLTNVMKTIKPNTTDQEIHEEEIRTKPESRFDSNFMSFFPTTDSSLSTITDTSSIVTDMQTVDDYDKSLMRTFMKDCQLIETFYQDWSFDYRYTRDEMDNLLCRCIHICNITRPSIEDVIKLRDYFQNPISDINLTRFTIIMSVYSMLFLVGVIGNATTIVGLLKWVRSKTPTLSFILSLAVIDLMLLIICVPLKLAETFEFTHNIGLVRCKLLYYFRDFTFVCSIFTMSVISFERYYAICHPLEAQYKCTKKRTRLIIITIWILSAIFAAPTIFAMTFAVKTTFQRKILRAVFFILLVGLTSRNLLHVEREHVDDSQNLSGTPLKQKSYTSIYDILDEQTCRQNFSKDIYMQLFCTYYLGILFVLPLLIMLYTYGCSCVALKKSANRSRALQNIGAISAISFDGASGSDKEGHNYQGRLKVIKMLIIILITFTICWGPSLIFQVLVIYRISIVNQWLITQVVDGLIFINSCSSPYIFMCMSSQFKTAAVDACPCATCSFYPCNIIRQRHCNKRLQISREFTSEISVATSRTSVCSISVKSY